MSAQQLGTSQILDIKQPKLASKAKAKKDKSSEIISHSEDLSDTFSSGLGKRFFG